jgi:hypothetical protein
MTAWGYLAVDALGAGRGVQASGEAIKELSWMLMIFCCVWTVSYWILRWFDRKSHPRRGSPLSR